MSAPIAARNGNSIEATVSRNTEVEKNDTGIWLCNQLTHPKKVLPLLKNPNGGKKTFKLPKPESLVK